jgi:nucleotide-binding universal stress UspA family protein
MLKLSRILVPVEFSPRCRGAVQYAEALADRFHSEIVLLHVMIPPTTSYSAFETLAYSDPAELAREIYVQRSESLAQFLCEAPENRVQRVVLEGDPARVIVDYAASESCDLIVMPTHGYGPFRRFLLGSVTAKVLHDAACPVCTGPHMEQAPDYSQITFRKVACAVDLGPHSRDIICYAGRFAGAIGASLAVIHALPASTTKMAGFYFDPDWGIQIAKTAREQIQHLLGDLKLEGSIAIESGETPEVVRTVALDLGADLLVIGRGSSAHAHGHLPTNSYAIVRESPCAVLAL